MSGREGAGTAAHEILFDADRPRQQVGHEDVRECAVLVQEARHPGLLDPHDGRLGERGRRRHAQRLAGENPSPKKSPARRMAMMAAFPRVDTTVSLTSPV